ncbi:MAG: amino acid adenylation domain-containing protein [Pseudomonadota bacterium]
MTSQVLALLRALDKKNVQLTLNNDGLDVLAPEGAIDAELMQALRAHKKDLVALLTKNRDASQRADAIPHLDLSGPLPLSFAQQRLWFLCQLGDVGKSTETSATTDQGYHLSWLIRVDGLLDVQRIAAALRLLVSKHSALRTVFIGFEGEGRQRILDHIDIPIGCLDEVGPISSHEQILERAHAFAGEPFDTTNGPLIRVHYAHDVTADASYLLITLHHLIADGWSFPILLRDFADFYSHPDKVHDPLPITYAEYATWQRETLQQERESLKAFWCRELSGVGYLQLPTDHPRGLGNVRPASRQELKLSEDVYAALQNVARSEKVSLYAVLLSAVGILLQRYSGERDFCVLTPSANRDHRDVRDLVGFFVNTLPIRLQVDQELTGSELVSSVMERLSRAQANQRFPYEELVHLVYPSRQNPDGLSSVMLAFDHQDDAAQLLQMPGLRCEPIANAAAKFELTISLSEVAGSLEGFIEYDRSLFDHSTILGIADNLVTVLESLSEQLLDRVSDIDLLTHNERVTQLTEWQSAPLDAGSQPHPLWLLAEQCATHSGLEAIRWQSEYGHESLTYEELYRSSGAIAQALLAEGAAHGDPVGVCMSRSGHLVAAMLGVMRAGCAYLPLDPEHAASRNRFILRDARAAFCLVDDTGRRHLDSAPDDSETDTQARVLDVAELSARTAPNLPLTVAYGSDDAAYIIYTSGSTGSPKGVEVAHRQLVSLHASTAMLFAMETSQRWSCFHSVAFDFSVWEVWCALLSGCTVCITPATVSRDPAGFLAWLDHEDIALLSQTPEAFYQLITAQQNTALMPGALRWVVFGGEVLDGQKLSAWWERNGVQRPRLVNMYGITETTVHSSFYPITAADVERLQRRPGRLPIGRGIPGTYLLLLDEKGRQLPQGAVGEIHVLGPGVSHGYRGQPELTAERFTTLDDLLEPVALSVLLEANPSLHPAQAVYRSGDLARYDASGQLEYMGRRDFQVKIRGFRIELGEIEAALAGCDRVADCRVLNCPDHEGAARLVAYWVPDEGSEETVGNAAADADDQPQLLRDYLLSRIPTYMMPAQFVMLTALPLTVNGKLDRKALPEPSTVAEDSTAEKVLPSTDTEADLVQIWRELLGISELSVTADLFAAGAHSLMFMRALSAVRSRYSADIGIDSLFSSTTIAGQARCIENVMAEVGDKTLSALPSLPAGEPHAMSWAQERLWMLDRLLGYSHFYHINSVFRIRGALDVEALDQAFKTVIARHHGLSSEFVDHMEVPTQRVVNVDHWRVQRGDAGDYNEQSLRKWMSEPFDLERPPHLRALLLQSAAEDYRLAVTVHHIVADGWSVGLFMQELLSVYLHLAQGGRESPLAPLQHQYADYARWQRDYLRGDVLAVQKKYWTQQLEDLPVLELPADLPRPPVYRYRGGRVAVTLGSEFVAAIDGFAQSRGASRYMVLLAAYSALLARYSGQSDIVVGTPVAGRVHPDTETMIGLFVNTLAMRVRPDLDQGFEELVRQSKEVSLAGYAHEDLPFEQLVELLGVARDASRTPVFQAMLVLQNTPEVRLQSTDLDLTLESSPLPGAKCDLSLCLSPTEDGQGGTCLTGYLEYNSDLFLPDTVNRWGMTFQQLLNQALARPDVRLGELDWLAQEERDLLTHWGRLSVASMDQPSAMFDQLFRERVATNPQAPALGGYSCVRDATTASLSYAELSSRVSALAVRIQTQAQLAPGSLVGVSLPRSVERAMLCMALWRLGVGYVPLDPAYPSERLADMVIQSGVTMVISDAGSLDAVQNMQAAVVPVADRYGDPKPAELHIVVLNALMSPESLPPSAYEIPEVSPDSLAYIIFTSGSTGRPKGVQVPHRCISHFLPAMADLTGISSDDRLLAVTSLSFDPSVVELFLPLVLGAELVVASDADVQDGHRLSELLTRYDISVLQTTPAIWKLLQLAEWVPTRDLLAMVGGEALSGDLASHLVSTGRVRLLNVYGPTETTVWCTAYEVSEEFNPRQSVPIGTPAANTRLLVVDAHQRPVPIGAPGRLLIAGEGVTDGYVGRSDLTQSRFATLPGTSLAQLDTRFDGVWYDSGDKVAWDGNGNLRYLGREDDQIKLRGFRVELGEIEHALRGLSDVQDAAVSVITGERLVAFLVLANESPASDEPQPLPAERFARSLRAMLPAYMVPSQFVQLTLLPLTPSGKVNRRGLPSVADTMGEVDWVAPRTETEQTLVSIWQELLHVDRLSVTTDVFSQGAHSLMFMRAVAAIRKRWSASVAIDELFQAPTIAAQADVIDQSVVDRANHLLTSLPYLDSGITQPLSWAQERLWILDQLLGYSHFYHITHVSRLQGNLDDAALERAFRSLIDRHHVLRTAFIEVDGEPRQQRLDVDEWQLERADAGHYPADVLQQWLLAPFDLARPPLLRAILLVEADNSYRLAVVVHHIVADGWSVGLFVQQLIESYLLEVAGEGASALAPPEHQYVDFASWQREAVSQQTLQRQLGYWREQLEGAPVLALPTDLPRPAEYRYEGGSVPVLFDAELLAALKQVAADGGASLYMVILALFSALLARYSGQRDVVIGTPVAGRVHPDVEDMIGMFVNTLAMRMRPEFDAAFAVLVDQSREVSLAAYANEDLPFEQLVEHLGAVRDTSRTPVFQAMLILQNTPDISLADTELTLSLEDAPLTGAKCDLTLCVVEREVEGREELVGHFEYNTSLFEGASVQRWAESLVNLARVCAGQPNLPLARLAYLSPEDVARQRDWGGLERAAEPIRTFADCFTQRVVEQPAAPAVSGYSCRKQQHGSSWCFGDLEQQVGSVAAALAADLRTGELVGIALPRSTERLVVCLALWRLGCAYVPLDPSYPSERLADMMVQGRLRLIVGESRSRHALENALAAVPSVLTRFAEEAFTPPNHIMVEALFDLSATPLPARPIDADSPAYVIFTSGSTGRPKGVSVSHRCVGNFLGAMGALTGVQKGTRLLAVTSLSFDISVLELFLPLYVGAEVVIAADEEVVDADQLGSLLERYQVDAMQATPATWKLLQLNEWQPSRPFLALCGGEPLSADLAAHLLSLQDLRLINLYGPTETTVWSTACNVMPQDLGGAVVGIGRPIDNTQILVLDERGCPVPVGACGRLFIAGAGVSQGYLGRPDLTEERFVTLTTDVSVSLGNVEAGPWYDTGDLVQWNQRGELCFVGRADDQVKLRGFRIELGEIEYALRQVPGVVDAAVSVLQGERLVAYLVGDSGGLEGGPANLIPAATDVSAALRETLPQYMIPQQYVGLPKLPLTPNGKVHRSALPVPADEAMPVDFESPATATEAALALLWVELLGVARAGRRDGFFALGGHSLLVLQLRNRIHGQFGIHLSLAELFRHADLAQMADAIDRSDQRIESSALADLDAFMEELEQ